MRIEIEISWYEHKCNAELKFKTQPGNNIKLFIEVTEYYQKWVFLIVDFNQLMHSKNKYMDLWI